MEIPAPWIGKYRSLHSPEESRVRIIQAAESHQVTFLGWGLGAGHTGRFDGQGYSASGGGESTWQVDHQPDWRLCWEG